MEKKELAKGGEGPKNVRTMVALFGSPTHKVREEIQKTGNQKKRRAGGVLRQAKKSEEGKEQGVRSASLSDG